MAASRSTTALAMLVACALACCAGVAAQGSGGMYGGMNGASDPPLPESALPDPSFPEPSPPEEGDLRLVSRVDINGFATGALQVFIDGAFGGVCINNFGARDADVACRQMGFVGGAYLDNAVDPDRVAESTEGVLAPFVLENLNCTGAEERLVDCPGALSTIFDNAYGDYYGYLPYTQLRTVVGTCDPLQGTYAFVACGTLTGPDDGDLRLEGGVTADDGSAAAGRLEIFAKGGWGTVCDSSLDARSSRDPLPDSSIEVACEQLGFTSGERASANRLGLESAPEVRRLPILLAGADCTGDEDSLAACPGGTLGDVREAALGPCGFGSTSVALVCFNDAVSGQVVEGAFAAMDASPSPSVGSGPDSEDSPMDTDDPKPPIPAGLPLLTPRLVAGEADPAGVWQYGRLEVFDGEGFTIVSDANFIQELTRLGVQVACRTLGFATGGQALAGRDSALPDPEGRERTVGRIVCRGDEATLSECNSDEAMEDSVPDDYGYERTVGENAVAIVCSNPSGCTAPEAAPMQGDVRLVPLPGIESPTQPCDAVHFGYAQIFNDGLWGSVCVAGIDRSHGKWTVDATVICRQLGFSFGNLMDARAPTFTASAGPTPPVFATDVLCTGAEDRFSDCFFPEAFGANEDASSGPGLSAGCFPDSLLAVMCRRFPMEETDLIRRL